MSSISLESLTKVYSTGVTALSSLSLAVEPGEFVVLVGPSGCGKTTALRMVAGLEKITSGEIRFGDRVVNDVAPGRRDVAMVFQNYALYPHLTVYQNIGFALENKKVNRSERHQRIVSTAAITGLSELLRRKPQQLSGGQRQRVAMARAIVRSPAVFLMDEPLSNLDAKLRVQMRAEVLRVHREVGAATLYVTHDQTEAMTMGDRVAVLRDGVLQQYATPRELYSRPANVFVASFIGSPEMNMYEGTISPSGSLVLGSQKVSLPDGSYPSGYAGRKVIVGIRPEDLGTADDAAADLETLTAEVRLVELLGDEQHVYFSVDAPAAGTGMNGAASTPGGDLAAGGILAGSAPNGIARVGPRAPVRAGDRVRLTVDPAALYFFDSDTGLLVPKDA
jgi:multiple sugar transport system ATP-binding protein